MSLLWSSYIFRFRHVIGRLARLAALVADRGSDGQSEDHGGRGRDGDDQGGVQTPLIRPGGRTGGRIVSAGGGI